MRKDGLLVTDEIGSDSNKATTSNGNRIGLDKNENDLGKSKRDDDPSWLRVVHALNARKFLRTEDIQNIDNFISDSTNGMKLNLKVGELGLVKS